MAAAKNVGFAYGFNVHNEDASIHPRPDTDDIPEAGHLTRDVIYGSNYVASHIVHLYHLAALDFIDPAAAGLDKAPFCPSHAPDQSDPLYPYYYRIPTAMAGSGSAGTYNLNVYLVAQYVIALKIRRMCNQITAIWGGRAPFVQGLTPGGAATSVSQDAIDKTREILYEGGVGGTPASPAPGTILSFVGQPTDFALWVADGADPAKLPIIGDVSPGAFGGTMLFDTVAVAMFYPEYFWYGNAYERFLAYGVFEKGDLSNPDERLLRRGRKIGGDKYPGTPNPLAVLQQNVFENVANSYYTYQGTQWKQPLSGETTPEPRKTGAYSWVKSPRYKDLSDPDWGTPVGKPGAVPYEVGPLARMQVNGDYYAGFLYDFYTANSVPPVIPVGPFAGVTFPRYGDPAPNLNNIFGTGGMNIPLSGTLTWPDLNADPYNLTYVGGSALDRYAARQLECWKVANAMVGWLNRLEAKVGQATSKTRTPPGDRFYRKSYGWTEAPRGALGHWMKLGTNGKIEKYQCVVPSTWNASPKDGLGIIGPAEKAMTQMFVPDINHPLEVLRVGHSWDFCTACAVHVVKRKKGGKREEKVVNIDPTHL
ncbi:MAG: nickel-dependent hydrogenase large subunit [Desulfobacterales bacterium]|nr:nickel-dependent hydrogenase large subunit [Desulfobacterales bacterium]